MGWVRRDLLFITPSGSVFVAPDWAITQQELGLTFMIVPVIISARLWMVQSFTYTETDRTSSGRY